MISLPYVKPLKSSTSCRMCRRWLEGEWSSASPEQKVELERQMSVGRCDECTRRAAREKPAMTDEELASIRELYLGHFDGMPVRSTLATIHKLLDEIDRYRMKER
jgi:hypothetical protein